MASAEIKPIRQIAKPGDNFPGRSSASGDYIYIPTTTSGTASIGKYDLSGTLIWERNLSNGGAGATCSVAPDGTILFASSSGGTAGKASTLGRFSPTGDKFWEITNSFPTFADVVVNGNTVYVSGGSGTGFNTANTAFINAYALDSGTLLWSKKYPNSGASYIGDLEIADGVIYAAASLYGKQDFDTGIVGKLDLNGNEIWWKSAPANDWNAIWAVRVVGDQVMGVGYKGDGGDRGDIRLIALNKNNGTILWDKSWGDSNQQGSGNIEIVNSKVYVSYGDGVAWNSRTVSGGYSVVDELDLSGNLLKTYKFDIPSVNDSAGGLIKVGESLYMTGVTNGTITGQTNGGGYDVYFASVLVKDKPVVRGNSLYTIVDGPSWTQAEANSVKLGGHLVAINNKSENTFISNSFGSESQSRHWLGLTRDSYTSPWKWVSGQSLDYVNWDIGEPNSFQSEPQNYAHIWTSSDWLTSNIRTQGTWNDTFLNSQLVVQGIAETPFIRRGDSAYVIVQGPTWEEAEANAVKLGGHLVTINDAAENEWISSIISGFPDYGIYIGASDLSAEGSWKNPEGVQLSYSNWKSGEPNGFRTENYGMIYPGNWQGTSQYKGQWNDTYYFDGNGIGKGIAELKLAPNNPLTGTPTLSGTFKAGQVITIDKTPIQDADNFTGYTPTYNYSFEVSNDNGTTWTKLISTDSTDNSTTYTLTTAEIGKQVRGVVSYLDGYGTQESVASTASAPITSSAPPVQSLTLSAPSKSTIRSGISTTSAIAYNVSTGETNLTGVGASLYFDSTQLTVTTAGDPFQKSLLGNAIIADTNNADGDSKTDKVLSLTYADFGGNFPGSGTTLPLTLANLNLVPTASYTGTTLHLKGSPATGFTATGADLTLGYNASPVVNGTLTALTTNRGSAFSYTVPFTLFSDSDSTITLSATTATGTALPSWLSFNASTRTLSGTPTTGGTLNLNLSASDELGSVSTPLSIKVREVQQLSSSTAPIRYQRNKDLTVPINYSTTDGSSSTGLAFKVHFNSSLFSFDPTTGVSNKAQADLFQVGAVQQDSADTDNDPSTDRFIPISIASFSGQFPSGSAPSKLADLTFRTADKAIDPLTGLRDTSINFSESSVASGYGFSGTSATLKPLSFSLDVDGDGLVTPLGDGLMVIRYLFGSAFAGDALINKAISPDSPLLGGKSYTSMSATEKASVASLVATNIQQGIDSQLLDVDKDGKTTPLGDGLMVIRRLFGSAFDGAALTSKAISPESPYFGPPADFAAVAANIDALKPTLVLS